MSTESNTYLALLRGVNVGGNSLIKMSELKTSLSKAGLKEVQTYIKSGNVAFASDSTDMDKLASTVKTTIYENFGYELMWLYFPRKNGKLLYMLRPTGGAKKPRGNITYDHN